GRVLLDVLRSGRIDITKSMTAEEREKEKKLRSDAVSLNIQLSRSGPQQPGDEERLNVLKSQLQKTRLEYEAFQTALYAAHPELRAQRGKMEPLTLERINRLIPDQNSAILEFAVLEDKSFLFVLTRKQAPADVNDGTNASLAVFTLPLKQKELGDLTQ